MGSLHFLVQADEPTVPHFLASLKSAAKEDHAMWSTLMSQFHANNINCKQGAETKLKWNSFSYEHGLPFGIANTTHAALEFVSPANGVEFQQRLSGISSICSFLSALGPLSQFLECLRKEFEQLIMDAKWTAFKETMEMHMHAHENT